MNIMITREEYNEYEAQKEKIKELETHNEFLRGKFDDLYEENVDRIKKCDTLEEQVDHWKMQFESTYKNYQRALSEKVALIEERDRLTNVVHKQSSDIVSLRAKIDEAENKDIRFKELVTENYRLRMSNNDLKENNKELKAKIKEYEHLNDFQAASSERAALINERDILKEKLKAKADEISKRCEQLYKVCAELESIKAKIKEPIASITINPCRDSEEAYSTDNNTVIKIENLYVTNNYFSEEDEDDE